MRRTWHRCAAVLSLALALLACSGDRGLISPGTMPTAMDLVIVSGSGQEGKVGRMLAEPFVVQVRDDWGRPARNVEVTWTVVSGDGVVRLFFMPTVFDLVTVLAEVAGPQGLSATFTIDASDRRAVVRIESGNGQRVFAGMVARPERLPFIIRVTDGDGSPVPNLRLGWHVLGHGSLHSATRGCSDPGEYHAVTRTGTEGEVAVEFSPTWLGVSKVMAALPGLPGPPIAFTVEANALAIGLAELQDPWTGNAFTAFVGFDYNPNLTWPIGAAVEFRSLTPTAHILGSSTSPGGASFDSGPLAEGERFQFVPDEAGPPSRVIHACEKKAAKPQMGGVDRHSEGRGFGLGRGSRAGRMRSRSSTRGHPASTRP